MLSLSLWFVEEMIEAVFTAAELDGHGAFGLPQSRVIVQSVPD